MLIGSSSRFVAGRSAVQTVYWRTAVKNSKEGESQKILKTNRTFNYPVKTSTAKNELPAARFQTQPIRSYAKPF